MGFRYRRVKQAPFVRALYKWFFNPEVEELDPAKCEDYLRILTELVVDNYDLKGCMLVHPISNRSKSKITLLTDPLLTFTILSKVSGELFVASKEPVFSAKHFEGGLITFDPRIVYLQERI